MRFKCTNPDCQHEHVFDGATTMRVKDGQIRHFNGSDDPIDLCTECKSACEEIRVFKGWGTNRGGTDSGTGKSHAR